MTNIFLEFLDYHYRLLFLYLKEIRKRICMFVLPNTRVPYQIAILSANPKDSQSLVTLKEALDNSSIHYKIIDTNNQLEIKNLQAQTFKSNYKHMIILENSDRLDLQLQIDETKYPNIAVYCYPKKNPSRKYTCLPNAGKVVNAYNNFISERESSSRIRLKSVCKSPEKIYPIYSKIFVHKIKQSSSNIYKKFAKYILELPNTGQFQVWRDLKKQKPGKKYKYFVLMSIDDSEDLIKNIYDSRISQYCDIGVVGVKPTQKLFFKNVGIAAQDIAKIIDFVSQRGFNLNSIKSKIATNLSFQSCKSVEQLGIHLSSNSVNSCAGLGKLKNKEYYQLPLSQIPQRRQTLNEHSKFFDSQKCDSQQFGTDPMSNLLVQSQRIVNRSRSKQQQKSRWAKLQDKRDEESQHGYYSVKDKSFDSQQKSKKNLSAVNKSIDQKIISDALLQNDGQSERFTYKSDEVQPFIYQHKDKRQIIFNSSDLNNPHQEKLNSEQQKIQNNGTFVFQRQEKNQKQKQGKVQFQSQKCKEQTSILRCITKSEIKQQNGSKILCDKIALSEQPQIIINYSIKEKHGKQQSLQKINIQKSNSNPFKIFQNQKLQSKSLASQHIVPQLVKQIADQYLKGASLLVKNGEEQKKQENNQSQSKREESLGQSQQNQHNQSEGYTIGLDSNIRIKQEDQKDQNNIKQAQAQKEQSSQTQPQMMNRLPRPSGKYFPSKIIQETSQQYRSGRESQATFLNEQLPIEGSLVSKCNKRSNTGFQAESSNIQIENKNKNRGSAVDFKTSSKSPQPSLNTIAEQQKAERSIDHIQNESKQATQKLLSKRQLAQIASQQVIVISCSEKNIGIDGSQKLQNSTGSFQLSVYLDKMNSRILKELQHQQQKQDENFQQSKDKHQQYIKVNQSKDIKIIQDKQVGRKSLANFKKQNLCAQQKISQQIQPLTKGVKVQKVIRISRFSLLNQVGVEQVKLLQSRYQNESINNIQEKVQLKQNRKQNESRNQYNIAEVRNQSLILKQSINKISQKSIHNYDQLSHSLSRIDIDANVKQKTQISDIRYTIQNILSPQKSNEKSQAPTNLNAVSSHVTLGSVISYQKITSNEHTSSNINVYNRKIAAPGKIIRVADLNLQDYIKTVDQKGRVIYRSRSSSVNPIKSNKISVQTPPPTTTPTVNYHEQIATVFSSYQSPVKYDNPAKPMNFFSSVDSPENRQVYRNSVNQAYYNKSSTYQEKYTAFISKEKNLNKEKTIKSTDTNACTNNSANTRIDEQYVRAGIISEKIPESIKINAFTDNYIFKQKPQQKYSDQVTGGTFGYRKPLSQYQQKIGLAKALQTSNSNGFGYPKQSSRNSGQLGLFSQIITNHLKDRAKKASNLQQIQDKKPFLKEQQNVYGLVKGKKQASNKMLVQNKNPKEAQPNGAIYPTHTRVYYHTKTTSLIKPNLEKSVESKNSVSNGRLIKNASPTVIKDKQTINSVKQYQFGKEQESGKYIKSVQFGINQTNHYDSKQKEIFNKDNNNKKIRNNSYLKQRTVGYQKQRSKSKLPKSQNQSMNENNVKSKRSFLHIQENYRDGSYLSSLHPTISKYSKVLTQILETSKQRSDSLQNTHLHTPVETNCYPDRCFQYQGSSFKTNQSNMISNHKDVSESEHKNRNGNIKRQQDQIRKISNTQLAKQIDYVQKFYQQTQGLHFEGKSPINKKQTANKFAKTRQSQVFKSSDSQFALTQNRTIMNSYNSGQKSSASYNKNKKQIKGPVRNKKVWKISSNNQTETQKQNKRVSQPRRSKQYYENYFNS